MCTLTTLALWLLTGWALLRLVGFIRWRAWASGWGGGHRCAGPWQAHFAPLDDDDPMDWHRTRPRQTGRCSHGTPRSYGPGAAGVLRILKSRLQPTPAQERILEAEVSAVVAALGRSRDDVLGLREDLADLMTQVSVEDTELGNLWVKQDQAVNPLRVALQNALRNLHGVLDDRQREVLAEVIRHSGWMGGHASRG